MNDSTRIAPNDPFPEDLTRLASSEVEILNSKIHRELDSEYVRYGLPDPETEARLEEITEELDRRESASCQTNVAPKKGIGE
ncbi:hypothetical protein [Arthrobacter sp. H20]|uniref:hypothetical protein n=1 Tax=Arthrobacter sp. H20 TaxID=1267981 RepID=UPI0004AE172F|nr:hypothetical protein [Arthrobacter sp. H20]